MQLVILCHKFLCCMMYVMGIWIFALSLIVAIHSGLFPLKLFLLNGLRIAIAFSLSYMTAFTQHLVVEGLVIGW